ncbi:hypothetical protein DNTS_007851 [Danionella cerebrum]|uniref:Methyltransferase domain-containing protein n=1 Tax=Danionella cerebrum TaxID=2873325 RepID=A0A553RG12_9TELE|nr:hypothetical protein DNTS_007851 [Danionella translucida]
MAVCKVIVLRSIFQLVIIVGLPILLLIQLLVSLTVPRAHTAGNEHGFLVITIEKNEDGSLASEIRNSKRGLDSGVLGPWTENSRMTGYEDENEFEGLQVGYVLTVLQGVNQELILQPWASDKPSFFPELYRLTKFITTIEVDCSDVQRLDGIGFPDPSDGLCLRHWKLRSCVAYSFSLDGKDAMFLDSVQSSGCEVHRFDPSRRRPQTSGSVMHHRLWLDWRKPRGIVGNVQHRLLDIMDSFHHEKVDVIWLDVESAEWRVLESWIKDGTLLRINQLILTVHLQWAGFEVGGAEEEVLRFWFSVLRGVWASGMRLVCSKHGPGYTVLRHKLAHAHSSYTLSWLRMREVRWHL